MFNYTHFSLQIPTHHHTNQNENSIKKSRNNLKKNKKSKKPTTACENFNKILQDILEIIQTEDNIKSSL